MNVAAFPQARIPTSPAGLAAEQALLGTLLYDPAAYLAVSGFLGAQHFAEPVHGRLYQAVADCADKGRVADPFTIGEALSRDPALQDLGGIAYLALLLEKSPPAANAPDYARLVFEGSIRRDLALVCSEGLREAVDGDTAAFSLVSELRRRIEEVENAAAPEDQALVTAPVVARKAVEAMRERAVHGKPRGLMTGLRCFDRRLSGLKAGALVIVGGRPGMCKTGLARAAAHGAAVRNPNHLFPFFNLEMEGVEVMQRELSALTFEADQPIEYRAMDSGALTAMDFMAIDEAEKRVPSNLILDDRCYGLSVDEVRRKVWALGRRGRVGAVFIDYLQLMRRPHSDGRNEASVIAEMTSGLKRFAREAKVCIVLLSQLSRAVEGRDDKRPQLSDLRESGAIEQDADAVLFPFREYYYLQKAEPRSTDRDKHLEWEMRCMDVQRRLDVFCAKQRGGPEGADVQRYFAEFDHFEDDHERA